MPKSGPVRFLETVALLLFVRSGEISPDRGRREEEQLPTVLGLWALQ